MLLNLSNKFEIIQMSLKIGYWISVTNSHNDVLIIPIIYITNENNSFTD